MKKLSLLLCSVLVLLCSVSLQAQNKEYYGSFFGIRSDGVTNNTGSLQYAVNFISEQGGGTLVLWVGRYLTGSIELKSNVTIQLNEGAILVGVPSPYDYAGKEHKALLWADGQENISVIGQGVIDGQGASVQKLSSEQAMKGYAKDEPVALIAFSNCKNVKVSGLMLKNAAGPVQFYKNCQGVTIDELSIFSKDYPKCEGLSLYGGSNITISNVFFDVSGFPIANRANAKLKVSNAKTASGSKNIVWTIKY